MSTFLFLPFGAGSKGGVLLYVTVLVTTDLTLTGLTQALRGSNILCPLLSKFQSAGEKGDRVNEELRALLGDGATPGDQVGEGGIRSRLSPVGVFADCGRWWGE